MSNNKEIYTNRLVGKDFMDRMVQLMEQPLIKGDVSRYVFELTKVAPNGIPYAIVRENKNYYIKVAKANKENLLKEDFDYIGGLKNKNEFVYDSYGKALTHLGMKFKSISESIGKYASINLNKNDNLISDVGVISEMFNDSDIVNLTDVEATVDSMLDAHINVKNRITESLLSDLTESVNVGGVIYDNMIASQLKDKVGDLDKLTPYVLEVGDEVYQRTDGTIQVYDGKVLVKKYTDIDQFLSRMGRATKVSEGVKKKV